MPRRQHVARNTDPKSHHGRVKGGGDFMVNDDDVSICLIRSLFAVLLS